MLKFLIFFLFQGTMTEGVRVTRMMVDEIFDPATSSHQTVYEYTLRNEYIIVKMLSYGATIKSILMPDKHGNISDVILGFDDVQGIYENSFFIQIFYVLIFQGIKVKIILIWVQQSVV